MLRFIFVILCFALFIGLLLFAYEPQRTDNLLHRQKLLQESLSKAEKESLDETVIGELKKDIDYLTQEIDNAKGVLQHPAWFIPALMLIGIVVLVITINLLKNFVTSLSIPVDAKRAEQVQPPVKETPQYGDLQKLAQFFKGKK